MKKSLSIVLIIFIILSCNKTVEKNTSTLVGIYTSLDANLFYKAFDSNKQESWLKSTLILNADSTYIFETEEILNKGNWHIINNEYIKCTCSFNVVKFDGHIYKPRIDSCKGEIPKLLFRDDTIMFENRKDQFEFVTKRVLN